MFCSCFIPQQMFPLRSSIAVARQWMDLQIVDFPSDLCGFSQRLVGFRLPDDGDKFLSGCPVNIVRQCMAMLRWTMACSVMQIVDQINQTTTFLTDMDL